jgi:hypothetical protein
VVIGKDRISSEEVVAIALCGAATAHTFVDRTSAVVAGVVAFRRAVALSEGTTEEDAGTPAAECLAGWAAELPAEGFGISNPLSAKGTSD